MTGHTHTLADLMAVLSVGVSALASIRVGLAFADADLAYFDPRPLLADVWHVPAAVCRITVDRARPVIWDVSRSEALYPLLREWNNAPHTARRLLRDAGLTLPALLILLTTRPTGAMA